MSAAGNRLQNSRLTELEVLPSNIDQTCQFRLFYSTKFRVDKEAYGIFIPKVPKSHTAIKMQVNTCGSDTVAAVSLKEHSKQN